MCSVSDNCPASAFELLIWRGELIQSIFGRRLSLLLALITPLRLICTKISFTSIAPNLLFILYKNFFLNHSQNFLKVTFVKSAGEFIVKMFFVW